ncbi:hypothetical protein ACOSQ2_032189 [Xanthoceras sorbifolium]
MEGLKHTRKKIKISDEMDMDRLSNLPESIIHHILSLMDAKYAVQTCILSKKWKFHWAHISYYSFNCSTSSSDTDFQDFVGNVLNTRKSFNLSRPRFRVSDITMSSLVKLFYHYVLSCRIEELDVRNKVQISDQMVVDRISSLPDPIIHHILSFTDTKYAVQTCVLSKKWRKQWTNIQSLNFDHSSFSTWVGFKDFVLNVLWGRKSLDVRKIKFICGGTHRVTLMRSVFKFASSHGLEELDTDAIGDFPPSLENYKESLYGTDTLKTLKIYHSLEEFLGFENLTTLQISASLPAFFYPYLYNDGLNMENLVLVNCDLQSGKVFTLYGSIPVNLTISNFRYCEKIVINSDFHVRILNWKGESPCKLSFEGSAPDEVNIHMSPPVDCQTKKWFTAMRDMVEGCRDATLITVSLDVSKGKFILSYSDTDAETKVVELNKETGEERLLFAFPMVSGFDLNQFATILEELFSEKKAQISNQMEIDRLSNLPEHIIHHILSFLDTKSAVQTCVLSKIWRYHWTHIHNLDLECRSNKITNFKRFVLDVLHHRKPLNLNRLRFHLRSAKSQALMRIISSYALSKSLKELDTNLTTFPPCFYQCQTLRTLKLGSCSSDLPDLSSLTLLTTLELTDVWLPDCDFFSRCLILENLSIIECQVMSLTTLNISAPWLVKLIISKFRSLKKNRAGKIMRSAPNDGKIVITAPRLKFFNLKEVDPLVLSMDDCPNLEKVDIHMSQAVCQRVEGLFHVKSYILDIFHMVEGLFHVKSFRISLNFTKEKFILCRNNVDEETKIAVLNKETGMEQLVSLLLS